MSKTWFISGSSRGLGHAIAEAVLVAGDRVVATARDLGPLEPLRERFGDRLRLAALDVTDEAPRKRPSTLPWRHSAASMWW
jgi:NADP-dependent 3-hydroxy acid dehydrogenase YdfG